jgi:site-specific DNA-methyltransferase (adenine-specific)
VKPYYQDDAVTIYHGDCREVLPGLDKADLLLTDPPYGIADVWKGGSGHGWAKASAVTAERNAWDVSPPDGNTMREILLKGDEAIVWGGNHFPLPISRGWLVWTKPERNFTLSEAELAWTTRNSVVRVFDGVRSEPGRVHPTQKPLALMVWCLNFFQSAQTVLDPFMGSGTTLRAAKDLGRKAIGIEIEERYCEMAAKRLAQEVLSFV